MDVSYARHPHIWELSDNDDDIDNRNHSSQSSLEAGLASDGRKLSEPEQLLKRVRRDLAELEINGLGPGESRSNSLSESESCGSSTGGGLAAFCHRQGSGGGFVDDDDEDDEGEDVEDCLDVDGGAMVGIGFDDLSGPDTSNGGDSTSSGRPSSSSSKAVFSSLKKSWKKVKKTGVKSTTSAGKSLTSLSSNYFSGSRSEATRETWEERHSRMGDEWLTSIIPSWHKKKKTTRVRTLVFRGIPANVRGRAWQCAIGNPLNVTEQLFDVLKDRAYSGRMEYIKGRETVAMADGDVGGNGGKAEGMMESERSAHKAIMLDLPRTFPELSFFHAEGSHYEYALRDLLEAFLYLRPDVGYSQGMSFLAAVLLLYMDPPEAFGCFVNMLLHNSCFLNFFRIKMPEVRFYLLVHERLLGEEMPSLQAHFRAQGIESDLYMINWVMSLYCRALPLDLVTRIWDLYVLDGDVAIFRAALGILKFFMPRLLKMKFEDMAYFLSHLPAEDIDPDALLQSIRSVRGVTRKKFCDLFKECESAQSKMDERGVVVEPGARSTQKR